MRERKVGINFYYSNQLNLTAYLSIWYGNIYTFALKFKRKFYWIWSIVRKPIKKSKANLIGNLCAIEFYFCTKLMIAESAGIGFVSIYPLRYLNRSNLTYDFRMYSRLNAVKQAKQPNHLINFDTLNTHNSYIIQSYFQAIENKNNTTFYLVFTIERRKKK